ncbi:hypothetical protein ACFPFV_09275 [Salinicoccus siamensis]
MSIKFHKESVNIDRTNYNGQVHKLKTKTSKWEMYISGYMIEVLQEDKR